MACLVVIYNQGQSPNYAYDGKYKLSIMAHSVDRLFAIF